MLPKALGRRQSGGGAALLALAVGTFTIGTAELLMAGILNAVANNLKVSVSIAGLLVTAYALGIAVGGPVFTALTMKVDRRLLLLLSLVVYIAGNILAVAAINYGMLMTARIITGCVHGLFIGVASAAAANLVPPERRGQAMSMIFGGLAVSTVVGVPLGTLIGQTLGWRAAFVAVVILAVLSFVWILSVMPPVSSLGAGGLASEARKAFSPRVLVIFGIAFVVLGGEFSAFTYITPFLQHITGISGGLISVFVLCFGVASATGNFIGGRMADRFPTRTLVVSGVWLALSLLLLYFAGSVPALVVVALLAWGLGGFALVPALQLRVINLAGSGADLAATVNASAVNAGIAAGAAVGGWIVADYGVRSVALVAAVVCAFVIPAIVGSGFLRDPSVVEAAPEPEHAGSQ